MTRERALAVLRRTLGEFHGEHVRVPSTAGFPTVLRMVARVTTTELTEAMNALAALEREETQ